MVEINIEDYVDLAIENEKALILLDAIFEEASINYDRTGIIPDVDTSKYLFSIVKALYPGRYAREPQRCKKEAEEYAGD